MTPTANANASCDSRFFFLAAFICLPSSSDLFMALDVIRTLGDCRRQDCLTKSQVILYTEHMSTHPKRSPALDRAIEAAGGISALGRKLGISRQAISQWDAIPVTRALQVEAITGIPRSDLLPEFFGNDATVAQTAAGVESNDRENRNETP